MGSKLSTRTRELAAFKMGLKLVRTSLTTEQAARLVAEADCQEWNEMGPADRQYYRTCAENLLERVSEPPHGVGMIREPIWSLI